MENIPKKTTGDQIHSGLKVALSLIPYAGSPLAVLFETVFSAPIDRRREVWFSSLESEIERLCKSVEELSPEALSKNEVFISVAMQATQIALRNHQSEKLEALRNAIINSALETSVDDNKVLIFTHIIDEITTLHIKVLSFLNNPDSYKDEIRSRESRRVLRQYNNNTHIWDEYYPELKSSNELIQRVVRELHAKGFVFHERMDMGRGHVTTKFGQEFIAFISPPK